MRAILSVRCAVLKLCGGSCQISESPGQVAEALDRKMQLLFRVAKTSQAGVRNDRAQRCASAGSLAPLKTW